VDCKTKKEKISEKKNYDGRGGRHLQGEERPRPAPSSPRNRCLPLDVYGGERGNPGDLPTLRGKKERRAPITKSPLPNRGKVAAIKTPEKNEETINN